MDNESLKNKNETKEEKCSMIRAQKSNEEIEAALKRLSSVGIAFHAIRYNP